MAGTVAAWAALAPPTLAQEASPSPSPGPATGSAGTQVVLLGRVVVDAGESVREVVVFSGRVQVDGLVRGDVVVFDGPVAVAGQVSGSVVALSGSVRLAATAQVGGDVLAHDRVRVEAGAQVGGQVREGVAFSARAPLRALGTLVSWLAVSVSTLLLGLALVLLAPGGLERTAAAARDAWLASAGWGVLLAIVLPAIAILATATVLGLPLGLTLLLALAFAGLVGYVLTVFAVGRLAVGPTRGALAALLAGWGIATAIGIVPYLNAVVLVAGSVFGLGLALVAAWRTRAGAPGAGPARPRRGGRHRAGRGGVEDR
jgi:cytoskeletal protein CcmA (bactofilin family)